MPEHASTAQKRLSDSEIRVLGIGNSSLADLIPADGNLGRWSFERAPDAAAALERLRSTSCDVVIVDLPSETLTGGNVIEKLRSACPSADVILLVEESTPQHVIDAIRAHAFSYFSKPFDRQTVTEMIRTAARVQEPDDSIELMSASVEYLSLRMRCSLHTVDRLVQFTREIPVELSLDERDEVAMAFREMLLNAIEYGGKLDPEEWVRVSRIRTRRTLVYHILDPGRGFSRDTLEHAVIGNPDDPVAHMSVRDAAGIRPGGFGMLLASSLVDEVIYNQQGNEVILIKYLD